MSLEEETAPMEPFSTLPFSTRWRYRPYNIMSAFTLNPGGTREICDLRRNGYIVLGNVSMNSPALTCQITLETHQEVFVEEFTAAQLFGVGWNAPMNSGWWVSVWDLVTPSFAVSHSPSPWTPFTKRLYATLINRTNLPITVNGVAVLCVEFLG